jgi:uncharacterized protein with HEPN domain
MRRDEAFLLDILQHARFVVRETSSASFEEFVRDQRFRLSLQKAMEIIGEAARKITKEFKREHPEIPWTDWIDLRHEFVHEYFRIDLAELWHAATIIAPQIVELIAPLVPPEEAV